MPFPGGELSLTHDADGTRVITKPEGLLAEITAD
jgi:hypothetical protein